MKKFFYFMLISVFLCLGIFNIKESNIQQVAMQQGGCIVVDAGHGGYDKGVVGKSGLQEQKVNLIISQLLSKSLEEENWLVVPTRTSEHALATHKKEDMQARKKIIASSNADYVISIHSNKFSDNQRRGVQVFYDDSKNGKEFAQIVQNNINSQINSKYAQRNFEAQCGDFFITKCTKAPSIIVECGFMSNSEDEKLLATAQYQNEVVNAIHAGLKEMVEKSKTPTLFSCGQDNRLNVNSSDLINTTSVAKNNKEDNIAQDCEILQPQNIGSVQTIMYHSVVGNSYNNTQYQITVNKLRADFDFLKKNGYNVISFKELDYSSKHNIQLPDKAVLITFDDGYRNNLSNALPLLEEYGYVATINVVGEFLKYGQTNGNFDERYCYIDEKDLKDYANHPNIEWGNHTYNMHKLGARRGCCQKYKENYADYKKIIVEDTAKMEKVFENAGIKTNIIAFPYGIYNANTVKVFRDMSYEMLLTCYETPSKIMSLQSSYLINRFNRDARVGSISQFLQ